jgi:hypothetical protein
MGDIFFHQLRLKFKDSYQDDFALRKGRERSMNIMSSNSQQQASVIPWQ